MSINLQHIFSQEQWHDDTYVVANRNSLLCLQVATGEALTKGVGKFDSFAADGEGYSTYIVLLDESRRESWQMLQLPYTDEVAQDRRRNCTPPDDLIDLNSCVSLVPVKGPCIIPEEADGENTYSRVCPHAKINIQENKIHRIGCSYTGRCDFISFVKGNGLHATGLTIPELPWYLQWIERVSEDLTKWLSVPARKRVK